MSLKKWELPKCPYCGKKLGFWEAWLLRTQGEYNCTKCSRPSNIKFQRVTYGMAAVVSVLGLGILILFSLLVREQSLWGVLLVIVPFVIFVFLSPCWMYLEAFQTASGPRAAARPNGGIYRGNSARQPSVRPPVPTPKNQGPQTARSVSNQTIVMPPVGRPQQTGKPVYRDASGRPVRPISSAGTRPQGQPPAHRSQQSARMEIHPPRPAGVRPPPTPMNKPAQERSYVPPPKKYPPGSQPNAQSILDQMTGRDGDRSDHRS